MKLIDEKTGVPLFAVLVALPFVIGGILWLSSIDSKASAAGDLAERSQSVIERQIAILQDIRERIIRIEEQLRKTGH